MFTKFSVFTIFLFLSTTGTSVLSDTPPPSQAQHYSFEKPTRGGMGKIYLGREIARVFNYRLAHWLDRTSRPEEESPQLLLENLPLKPDFAIADIGAGTGYLTFPLSQLVPEGRVFAVDIQPEMLKIIEQKSSQQQTNNIVTIEGSITTPNLPENKIDLVLMVDTYHEFSHPREMMVSIIESLKPGGKVVLVEYREEDKTLKIKPLHKMTEEQARKEMEAVGLRWLKTEDVLPQQHLMVFEKPL